MNYHNITYPDMNNGEGLRVALWLSGCHHHCVGCQNQQTWSPNSGIIFDDNAKEEIIDQLKQKYISGLTLSGGDPLADENLSSVLVLIKEIRSIVPQKNIWLYSGYTFEEIFFPYVTNNPPTKTEQYRIDIVKQCDVIVDGRYIDSLRDINLHYRGSSNQRLIDVQQSLKERKVILWEE